MPAVGEGANAGSKGPTSTPLAGHEKDTRTQRGHIFGVLPGQLSVTSGQVEGLVGDHFALRHLTTQSGAGGNRTLVR